VFIEEVEVVREVGRGREEGKEEKVREVEREEKEKSWGEKGKWSNRGLSKLVFGQNGIGR
jgi:hypothetical protein